MAKKVLSDLDFNSVSRIQNLPAGVAASDPVIMSQLNAAIEGLDWKDNVRVSTQGNLNIASPGATIDGITMVANDRVLVRAQSTGTENGIYIWNGAATPMTRAPDAATGDGLESAVTIVDEGTSAGAAFRQTTVNFTVGVGTITWSSFVSSSAPANETTAGIIEIATQAETDTGTDDARAVTPLKLAAWAGRKLKYSATFGDGSATSYTLTHNLGTRDVEVEIFLNSGNYDSVMCDVQRTSINAVTLVFSSAPASNALRATILG